MHGTWKTTGDGGGGSILGALVLGVVILGGGGIAAGIAEGVAESVHALLIIFAGLVAIVAGGIWLVIWRLRRGPEAPCGTRAGRQAFERQAVALHEAQKPAIAAPQQLHVHLHGYDEDRAAQIIRQALPRER
jgi:hypothetical protein